MKNTVQPSRRAIFARDMLGVVDADFIKEQISCEI